MKPKQVIVMRTDLGMRKGKMIAQGAHASITFLSNLFRGKDGVDISSTARSFNNITLSGAALDWVMGSYTKICVRVDSEEELMEIYEAACNNKNLNNVYLITDNGQTEFNGVPTRTCLAIGPDWAEDIDSITGHLKLL